MSDWIQNHIGKSNAMLLTLDKPDAQRVFDALNVQRELIEQFEFGWSMKLENQRRAEIAALNRLAKQIVEGGML